MKTNKTFIGHFAAIVTVFIWGTTFISTKMLLANFTTIEIFFTRFVIGLIALTIAFPKRLKGTTKKQELTLAAAGLSGIALYFLFENIALIHTLVSNVGVIISIAPFFTAILSYRFLEGEKPSKNFFLGFVVSIIGIAFINFSGNQNVQINPLGDLLVVFAAFSWAVYSVLTKKISTYGYNTIQTTRRIFLYGIIFMLPTLFFFPAKWDIPTFLQTESLLNFLFLGLGASAMCFATWNMAVKILGAVKTSVYIYMSPAITVVVSVLVLNEKITLMTACGTILTMAGLFISEKKSKVLDF